MMTLGTGKLRVRQRMGDITLGIAGLLVALGVGLLPLPLAVALLLLPLLVGLCFLEPLWALYLLVLSVPIQEIVLLPGGLTVTQFFAGLALFSWILRMLMQRDVSLPRPLLLPWLGFLTVLLLAATFAEYSIDQSIKELGRWVAAFLAFQLTAAHVTTRRRAWGLVACLLLAAMAAALLGLWQFATATGPPSFQIGRFVRAYGPFGKPNPMAGYMNMAWPLAAALTLVLLTPLLRRMPQQRPPYLGQRMLLIMLCAGCTLLLLAAEAATYSRGGWLGTLAGMIVVAALVWSKPGLKMLLAAVAIGGLLLILLLTGSQFLPASITQRIDSIVANIRIFDAGRATVNDESFAIVERMAHWQAGAYMFLEYPLLGVGPGNFYLGYRDYFVGQWYISQGHAHNYYIHIAAEAGAAGLLAYLLLIAAIVRKGLRAVSVAATPTLRALAIGGCGIIAAVAVHNVFENLHVLNMGIQLSAVWGLLAWIADDAEQRRGENRA